MKTKQYTVKINRIDICRHLKGTVQILDVMNEAEVQHKIADLLSNFFPNLVCTIEYNAITNEGHLWGELKCLGDFEIEGRD